MRGEERREENGDSWVLSITSCEQELHPHQQWRSNSLEINATDSGSAALLCLFLFSLEYGSPLCPSDDGLLYPIVL